MMQHNNTANTHRSLCALAIVFTSTKGGRGCSLIRVCSLIRSNTVIMLDFSRAKSNLARELHFDRVNPDHTSKIRLVMESRVWLTAVNGLGISPPGLKPRGNAGRAGSNGIDIEVSRHHTVSVSNFQNIEASTENRMVNF